MDVQKAMKIVYDEIKRAKDFSAEGTDIMISPKDFKDALSGTELWRTVQKMSKDYDLFSITLAPDAIIAHQYDDINDLLKPSEEHKHKHLLHLNNNFEGFPAKILKELQRICMTESMVSLSSEDVKLTNCWNAIMRVMNSLELQLQHLLLSHQRPLKFLTARQLMKNGS